MIKDNKIKDNENFKKFIYLLKSADLSVYDLDNLFETLADLGCLSDSGLKLKTEFWSIFISSNEFWQ